MKLTIKLLILLSLMTFMSSCSWIYRFMIFNSFDHEISVEFEFKDRVSGFPIFNEKGGAFYTITPKGKIDWDTHREVSYITTPQNTYMVTIPAKTAFEFGALMNDNYERYDQYFINGRYFNIKTITIQYPNCTKEITAETFDQHLTKNQYGYKIQL